MNVLTVTTLYPNQIQPRHGIFVKSRLAEIDKLENFSRKTIVPIPHFPFIGLVSNRYRLYNKIPSREIQDGVPVYHPRYFTLPGVKLFDNAASIAKSADKLISELYSEGTLFDLVDGQFLYPDGVAAYKLANKYNKPLVLTAPGSDVNYWMTIKKARKQILKAIDYSSKVICVSRALKAKLITYGVSEDKIVVILNGINSQIFNTNVAPNPTQDGYFLSVGNLVPLKGHDLTLKAFADLPDEKLIIVGDGELKQQLVSQAQNLGLSNRVQFINYLPQEKLAELYAGAKATILMSSMEGMPNVILESLGVGTPVIASNVGGISEIVTNKNGIILNDRCADTLIKAIKEFSKFNGTKAQIANTISELKWDTIAKHQYEVYKNSIYSTRS
jgi:teichuronic acid biosynthesis glycosyltransferase TuaC